MAALRQVATCVVLLIAASGSAGAQSRFEALAHEQVAATQGIEVITIRDRAIDACYTLFLVEPPRPLVRPAPMSVDQAAAIRDQQLAALANDFVTNQVGQAPGMAAPTVPYHFEADKVNSDYERRLREHESLRTEELLAQIVAAPRMAVAGPAPCALPPQTRSAR